jgi:isochorismate synthase
LRATLKTAETRARRSSKPVAASYTCPAPSADPLGIYAAAATRTSGEAWYWEQPSRGLALAGSGVAAEWRAERDGLAEAAAAWRMLLADAVIQSSTDGAFGSDRPVCFGGFAFDVQIPQDALWYEFPAALLVLPEVTLAGNAEGSALTLTALVQPFDDAEEHARTLLAHAARLWGTQALARESDAAALAMHELLAAQEWMRLVAEATRAIADGGVHKVVLARAVEAYAEWPLDAIAVLRRLRALNPTAATFAVRRAGRTFLGATPEPLACVRNGQVETMALAGTAPRGATPTEDARLALELLQSAKNLDEHRVVVSSIAESLAPICRAVVVGRETHIRGLPNVQHLETAIAGDLLPGKTLLDATAALHPTPAVAGFPQAAAVAYIREHEQLERGWYAGALGWIGADGGGECAVALRSALLEGNRATLFAGCGIVAGSDPEAEYAESRLKLRVMLDALGAAGVAAGKE